MLDPQESRTSFAAGAADSPGREPPRRRRGRPLLMSREEVLDRIRARAVRGDGLFRVHHADSSLYARARRMFGSWRAAVLAAGVDYRDVMVTARRRSQRTRARGGAVPGRRG
jgi:hypothetical protein